MTGEIRCAAIGLGRLGYWHAENLQTKVKSAKLVKVVSSRTETAEKAARELGVEGWTTNPNEVFTDPNIDAVIISTPTDTHAQYVKMAAQFGKHIFVEKPIAKSVEDARELVRLVEESGITCQVGFMRRFDPAYAEAKKRIDAGDIGKPIYFKGVSRDPASPPESYIKHSGGIFLDLAVHDFDIARYLMGSEVRSVRSMGSVQLHPFMNEYLDVDQALSYLNFESGATGDVESSRNAGYGYDIRGEVIGTEGTIQISSLKHHDLRILNRRGSSHDIIPEFATKFKDAFLLEMVHFIDCLRNGTKPSCTEVDGLRALEIAKAATDAYLSNKEIIL
ncbi:inositol 2-dehydrogenase [Paenibacillus alginolyticus]|uniref:inositol 2-dehydrogenase n=1 Tax=Paenibacillus alginolyticus TaxID=59839 RepID=UPI00042572C5|nr:inositol 2-dehydrogenase [Paenibacillus alginolyticus]MCY9665781.1 inositol 2-dehydrogenase [Paenibacillus alginolyticus]